MSRGIDIPKPIKTAIGTVIGLLILAIVLYALFSTTDILKKSSPDNQNINDSLTAIENRGRDILGADGTYTCKACENNFWTGFWVGVIVLIILIAIVIGIIWLANYLIEEHGNEYGGGI